jgi:hypothetical protein
MLWHGCTWGDFPVNPELLYGNVQCHIPHLGFADVAWWGVSFFQIIIPYKLT